LTVQNENLDAPTVEKKTASELAEMVATRISISAAAIKVMPDPVYGWRVMVIGPRATVSKYQPKADRIRDELCTRYELER
jgi:alanine racemase